MIPAQSRIGTDGASENVEFSDYFILYVALFLFLAALLVGALIIIALHIESKGKVKPRNALKSSGKNGNASGLGMGARHEDKRAAVSALRTDIDLALYTLELEGKTSVAQCHIVVQQVYQSWLKKNTGLFPGSQGKIAVTGKKAGLWTYRLPRDLEDIVAGIAG